MGCFSLINLISPVLPSAPLRVRFMRSVSGGNRSCPGALRGVPADGGASETLWARTRGKAFPHQKFCIIIIHFY
jgi:hypothetical protein